MIFMIFFFWFSPFSPNDHPVCCSWFVSNFRFVWPSTVWRDLVTMFLCWKSSVPSLNHYNVPQPAPTCGLPAFLSSPGVSASMTVASLCSASAGMLYWVSWGPLRALFSLGCLMGMWHMCAPAFAVRYSGIVSTTLHISPRGRKPCPLTSFWGGVKCPGPLYWSQWESISEQGEPTGLVPHSHWMTPGQAHSLLTPPSQTHFQSMLAAFSFLSLSRLWSWFNPVHPAPLSTALSSPWGLTPFCYHCS